MRKNYCHSLSLSLSLLVLTLTSSQVHASTHIQVREKSDASPTSPELKVINIQSEPLLYLVKGANIGFQYGVTDRFTIGPSIAYFFPGWSKDVPSSSFAYELQANYWINADRFQQGWFGRSYVGRSDSTTIKFTDGPTGQAIAASKLPATDVALLAGYHLNGYQGFNVEAAAGLGYYFWDTVNIPLGDGFTAQSTVVQKFGPRMSIRMGWTF